MGISVARNRPWSRVLIIQRMIVGFVRLSSDPLVELSAYHHVTGMASSPVSSRESESSHNRHSSLSSDSMITYSMNDGDSNDSCAGSILHLYLINTYHLDILLWNNWYNIIMGVIGK